MGDSLLGPPPIFHRAKRILYDTTGTVLDVITEMHTGSCDCKVGNLCAYPGGDRFGDRACIHQACPANRCIGGTIELRCAHRT